MEPPRSKTDLRRRRPALHPPRPPAPPPVSEAEQNFLFGEKRPAEPQPAVSEDADR